MKRNLSSIGMRDDKVNKKGLIVTGIGIAAVIAGLGICVSSKQWFSPEDFEKIIDGEEVEGIEYTEENE